MMKSTRACFALILIVLAAASTADAGDQPIVVTDLLRMKSIASIDVSDDGTKAVYAVRSIAEVEPAEFADEKGEYKQAEYAYESHLFLLDLTEQNAHPMQLTHGRRSDSSPVFSRSGDFIAFVREGAERPGQSNDEEKEKPQVWILPLTGGEARQITTFEFGATSPAWSPLGDALLVASAIPGDEIDGAPAWNAERPQRAWNDARFDPDDPANTAAPDPAGNRDQIRAWLALNESVRNPSAITRLDFHDETSLRKPYEFTQLFLIDPTASELQTHDTATRITNGFFDCSGAAFMPDGQRIVYAAKKSDSAHPDRLLGTDLHIAVRDGTADTLFLAREGWTFSNPKPSRDGSVIAFTAEQLDEPNYRQTVIGMMPARPQDGDEPIFLTDSFDRSVNSFEWMAARGSILFTAPDQGSFPLFQISTGLLQPAPVVEGTAGIGVGAFDVGGGAIVWEQTSPSNPAVLMVRTPGEDDRVAHDLNPWVREKKLSLPTPGWLERPGSSPVHYWIMQPGNLKPEEKYPLCVEMHGGPAAMWGPGESTMWLEFQLLCSWGYGVVYCNPRGSGGYGYAFQKANHQNWGSGPGGDVLAVVDRALAEPWVDSERLVLTGGSYAGYLTAWIVANDHRFKAAAAQRGVYDLTTFFGEGNAWRLVEWAMGGRPWDSNIKPILERESPFWQVRRIRTPLLIMHASNDLRTGVSQSEMLYRALKVLERPVEYVRYPNAGHDLSRTGDPLQRMDRLNRIIEFFERHIVNRTPAPTLDG